MNAKSFELSRYQRDEWKYHRHSINELRAFIFETKKLDMLQQIHYYLGHLVSVHIKEKAFSHSDQELLIQTIDSTVAFLQTSQPSTEHVERIKELDEQFWRTNEANQPLSERYHHHFTTETIVLFVILSIHDVLEEMELLQRRCIKQENA